MLLNHTFTCLRYKPGFMFSHVSPVDSSILILLLVVVVFELKSAREPRRKADRVSPAAAFVLFQLPPSGPPPEDGTQQRLGRGRRGPRDRSRRRRPPLRNSVAVELRTGIKREFF